MKSRVTLRDIATAAGVHYSTISLALRDHPRISLPIRAKVKKLAAEMGYTPDPALSALNAYRKTKLPVHYQSTLAWIDNWKGPIKLRGQPTFNEYFLGASDRARQLGYELEEFRMEENDMTPERASRILQSRGIKGLLLAPQPSAGMKIPFNYDWFSTVTFGYSLQPRVFHLVTNHQTHSINTALENLTQLGYKKIGLFLHEDVDEKVDNSYVTGFWHFFQKHPQETYLAPKLVKKFEGDYNVFVPWFKKNRPDAVITVGGLAMTDWLESVGVRVPQDVGCARLSIGKDEEFYSGIHENGHLIGKTAVDFLVGMLQRGELGFPEVPIRVLVEGVWKAGKTLRQQ